MVISRQPFLRLKILGRSVLVLSFLMMVVGFVLLSTAGKYTSQYEFGGFSVIAGMLLSITILAYVYLAPIFEIFIDLFKYLKSKITNKE